MLTGPVPRTLPLEFMAYLFAAASQPVPTLSPQISIPADLRRNRPDIRVAERGKYAVIADVGVAQANLYPRLSLSGAITLNVSGNSGGTDYFFRPVVQFSSLD